jgi:hypothetical protein
VSDGRRAASAPPVAVIVDPAGPGTPFVAPKSRWSKRPSGWEIALWAFGILLVIASVQANVTAMETQFNGMTADGCAEQSCLIYTQAMYALSPGAFTAGLITIALALAVRAVKTLKPTAAAPVEPAAPSTAPADPQVLEPAQTPTPTDQPAPAFPASPQTFFTPPAPTQPAVSRTTRNDINAPAVTPRTRPLTPSSEPAKVQPEAMKPVNAPVPPRPPVAAPRRRADVDHSLFMRPTDGADSSGPGRDNAGQPGD